MQQIPPQTGQEAQFDEPGMTRLPHHLLAANGDEVFVDTYTDV